MQIALYESKRQAATFKAAYDSAIQAYNIEILELLNK
jgi:hypothetical protein